MSAALTLIGAAVIPFVFAVIVQTLIGAKDQQRKNWQRYGIRSGFWQIVLEIWNIRKVK